MNLFKLAVSIVVVLLAQPGFAHFRPTRNVAVCHTPLCKRLNFPVCRNLKTQTVVVPEFLAGLLVKHGDCFGRCPCDRCPDDPDKTEPGICGCGFGEIDNTNGVGCTFCLAADPTGEIGCQAACTTTPPCLCGGDEGCCAQNPCCDDCPGPKGPECTVNTCGCEPEECCFTVCPNTP